MSSTKKKKIEFGRVDLPKDEFEPRKVKVRVTIMIDMDVVLAFKKAASEQSIGYQTLMNQKLRDSMDGLDDTLEARIAALENAVELHQRSGKWLGRDDRRQILLSKRPRGGR